MHPSLKPASLILIALILASTLTPLNTVIAQETPRQKALEELSKYIQENYRVAVIGLYRGPLYEYVGEPLTKEMRDYDKGIRQVLGKPVISQFNVNGTYVIKEVSPLGRVEKEYEAKIVIDENLLFPLRLTPLFSKPDLLDDYAQALAQGKDANVPYETLIVSGMVPEGDFFQFEYRLTPGYGLEFKPTWLYTLHLPRPGEKVVIPKGESVFITLVPKKASWTETARLVEKALENILTTNAEPVGGDELADARLAELSQKAGVETLEITYVSHTPLGLVAPIGIDAYEIPYPREYSLYLSITGPESNVITGEGLLKACQELERRILEQKTDPYGSGIAIQTNILDMDPDTCLDFVAPSVYEPLETMTTNILAPQGLPDDSLTARVDALLPLASDFILAGAFYTIAPESKAGDNPLTITVTDGRGVVLASYQLTVSIGEENYAEITISDAAGMYASQYYYPGEYSSYYTDLSQIVTDYMRTKINLETQGYDTYGAMQVEINLDLTRTFERDYQAENANSRRTGYSIEKDSYTLRATGLLGGYYPNPFPPGNILILNYNSTMTKTSMLTYSMELDYTMLVPTGQISKEITRQCIYGVDPPSWVPFNERRNYCNVLKENPVLELTNLDPLWMDTQLPPDAPKPPVEAVEATAFETFTKETENTVQRGGLLIVSVTPDPFLEKVIRLHRLVLDSRVLSKPPVKLGGMNPPFYTVCDYTEQVLGIQPPPPGITTAEARILVTILCYQKPDPDLFSRRGVGSPFYYKFWTTIFMGEVRVQDLFTPLGGHVIFPTNVTASQPTPEVIVDVNLPQPRMPPADILDEGVTVDVSICLQNIPSHVMLPKLRLDVGVQESLETVSTTWLTLENGACTQTRITAPLSESEYVQNLVEALMDSKKAFLTPFLNIFAKVSAYDDQDVLFASGKGTATLYLEPRVVLSFMDMNFPLSVEEVQSAPLTQPLSELLLGKIGGSWGPLPPGSIDTYTILNTFTRGFTILMVYASDTPSNTEGKVPIAALFYDNSGLATWGGELNHPSGQSYPVEQVLEKVALTAAGSGAASDIVSVITSFRGLFNEGKTIDLGFFYRDGIVPVRELLEDYAGLGENDTAYLSFSLVTFAVTQTDEGYHVAPYLNIMETGPVLLYDEGDIMVWSEEEKQWVFKEGAVLRFMTPLSLLAVLSKTEALLAGYKVNSVRLSFLLADQKVIGFLEPLDWLVDVLKPLIERVPVVAGLSRVDVKREFDIFTLSSNIHLRSDPLLSVPDYYVPYVSMYAAGTGLGGDSVISKGIMEPGSPWQGLAKAAFYLMFQAKYQRNAQIMSSVAAKYIVLPYLLSYYFDNVFTDYTKFGKKLSQLGIKDTKGEGPGALVKKWQLTLIVGEATLLALNSLVSMFGPSLLKLFDLDPNTLSLMIAGSFKVLRLGTELLFIKVLGPRALVEDLSFEILYQLFTLVLSHMLYTFYQASLLAYLQNNLKLITLPSTIDLASVLREFAKVEKQALTLGVVWMGFVLNKASTLVSLVRGLDGIFFYDMKYKKSISKEDYKKPKGLVYKVYEKASNALVGFFEKSLAFAYRMAGINVERSLVAMIDIKEKKWIERKLTLFELEYFRSKMNILSYPETKKLLERGLGFDKKLKNAVSRLVLSGGTMLSALLISQTLTMWMAGSVLINPTNPTLTQGVATLALTLEAFLLLASFLLGVKGMALTKVGGVILKSPPVKPPAPHASASAAAAPLRGLTQVALAGPLAPALDAVSAAGSAQAAALQTSSIPAPLQEHEIVIEFNETDAILEPQGPLAERLAQLAQEVNQTYLTLREGLSTARVSLEALGRYYSLLDEAMALAQLTLHAPPPAEDPLTLAGIQEEVTGLEWAAAMQLALIEDTLTRSYPRPLPSDIESLDTLASAIVDSLQILSYAASLQKLQGGTQGPLIAVWVAGVETGDRGTRVSMALANYGDQPAKPDLTATLFPSLAEVKVPPAPVLQPGEEAILNITIQPGQLREATSLEVRLTSPHPGGVSVDLAGFLQEEAPPLEQGVRIAVEGGQAILLAAADGRVEVDLSGVESLFIRIPHSLLQPPAAAFLNDNPLPVLELVGEGESVYVVGGPQPMSGVLRIETAAVRTSPVKAAGGQVVDTGLGVELEVLGEGEAEGVVTLVERNPYAEAEEQARALGLRVFLLVDIVSEEPVRVRIDYRELGWTEDYAPQVYKYRSEYEAYMPLPTTPVPGEGVVEVILPPGDPLLALGPPPGEEAPVPMPDTVTPTPRDGGEGEAEAPRETGEGYGGRGETGVEGEYTATEPPRVEEGAGTTIASPGETAVEEEGPVEPAEPERGDGGRGMWILGLAAVVALLVAAGLRFRRQAG